MSDPTRPEGAVQRVPVHARITELGDRQADRRLTVICPRTGQPIALNRCLSCERAVDLVEEFGHHVVVCRDASAPATDGSAARTVVRDLMRPTVVCVDDELGMAELAEVFSRHGLKSVPVVDDDGRVVGIASEQDLIRGQLEGSTGLTVADVMTTPTLTIRPETHVVDAARLMAQEKVHHLPVVSADDEVLGVISTLDVTAWLAAQR